MCSEAQRRLTHRGFVPVVLSVILTIALRSLSAQTFTSSTELVLVPVVVNDKSGSHISPPLQT